MDNLVVFYYLGVSEIWSKKTAAFGGRDHIRRTLLYLLMYPKLKIGR